MIPIRYAKRTITDKEQIDQFLSQAKTGHLGMTNGIEPYIIPLNFCWLAGKLYFHGADSGRKIEMIQANNRVCFSVCEEYGTIADPVPAHVDTAYMSVLLAGTIERVEEHVLKYRSSMGSVTAVFRITPDTISAKGNLAGEEKKFFHGRKVEQDV